MERNHGGSLEIIRPPLRNRLVDWMDQRLGISELTYPVPEHANNVLYTLGVWMANLVMITLLLHALRVFVTGSYRAPREINWVVGIGLLSTMFGLVFTGTVLKWDQEGWEALQHNEEIGNLLGGLSIWFTEEFTKSTPILERLFVAHVAVLPFILLSLAAVHFFLVKHHGISSLPGHEESRPAGETDTEAALEREGGLPFTNHVLHILGWGLLVTALAGVLSLLVSAPLGEVINPELRFRSRRGCSCPSTRLRTGSG